MSVIKKCDCKHEFQDKRYGKGQRVMNELSKTNRFNYRCTVCKKERL